MNIFKRLTGLIIMTLTAWYSLFTLQPPQPIPANAPANVFSAERAFEHVKQIAQKPHPLGTEENKKVRAYIVKKLSELGVQTDIKEGPVMFRRIGIAAYVHNILAKIPGTNANKTILLMAHYDSAPNSRGAGDDGAGVAAILEIIRVLKLQEPLKNNVWILITDGEELGLLGARYFIGNNPNWKQIDLVMNVEARGSSGPSIMFETSNQNAALISYFAQATAHPIASSLTYTLYKLLPNDTDLSVIKNAGLAGLNFAFAYDYLNYHSLQDNPKNLSLASLQHHGSNVLSNVLYFGNHNFKLHSSHDRVYFNGLFGGVITYSATWSLPIAIIITVFFILLLIVGFLRKNLSIGKYFLSILAFILTIAISSLLTYGGWALMDALHPEYQWLTGGEVYVRAWYSWGFIALTLAVSTALFCWLHIKLGPHNLVSGIFTIWTIITIVTAWYLPTASYLFTWPLIFTAVAWLIASLLKPQSWLKLAVICLGVIPAIFMIFPLVQSIQIMMTSQLLWMCMLVLALLIGLCWPLVELVTRKWTIFSSITLFIFFLVGMIGASLNSGFDANHKKQNGLFYAANLSQQKAWWLSTDKKPDSWTSQFLGDNPDSGTLKALNFLPSYLHAKATFYSIPKAQIGLLADSTANSLRYISLQIQSKAEALRMRFSTDLDSGFVKVTIAGKEFYNKEKDITNQLPELDHFYYFADLNNPVILTLAVPSNTDSLNFEVRFASQKWFKDILEYYEKRPPTMMPNRFSLYSNLAIWQQQINIDELKSEI